MTVRYAVLWRYVVTHRGVPALAARVRAVGVSAAGFARATERIEADLAADPDGFGESRPDWLRVHHVYPVTVYYYPVTVYYEVHENPSVVFVHRLVLHAGYPR